MHQIALGVTLLFLALLVAMVAALAFEEKLHARKSLITGTAAVIAVFLAEVFHVLPIGPVVNVFKEKLHIPVYIAGIEWEVIAIIVGSSLFVDVASRSGLFTWIAIKLTKRSGGDPRMLLYFYSLLTILFSAFLNNVTAMVIVGSLTAVSLERLNRKSLLLGFLLVEGFLTNVGGLLTLISSVPNIIIGQAAGITFLQFMLKSTPYVLLAAVATVLLAQKRYSIPSLQSDEERALAKESVSAFDENDGIHSPRFFYTSGIMAVLLILLFATTSYLPYLRDLGLGFVALSFGILMLWAFKHEVGKFYSGLDWDLVWFFMTLFVVINVMEHAEVLSLIGSAIGGIIDLGDVIGSAGLLWCSAAASSVTDNIPLAAVLAKVLKAKETLPDSSLWWSVIFGSNLGGNLTPIGSASTVVAVTIMHKHEIRMSFLGFIRAALPFALLQIILATAYLLLFL